MKTSSLGCINYLINAMPCTNLPKDFRSGTRSSFRPGTRSSEHKDLCLFLFKARCTDRN